MQMSPHSSSTENRIRVYEVCRFILGKDFISPEEITAARGIAYTNEQHERLVALLPSTKTVAWCKASGAMLVPTPPKAMSLLDIHNLRGKSFGMGSSWFFRHPFFLEDKTEAVSWLALRKSVVPDSTNKDWAKQLSLLSEKERVPNAAELAWGLTTYKEVRGIYLMNVTYARTTSTLSDSRRVNVGYFNQDGLCICAWLDECNPHFLGVSSTRRPV